MGKSIMDNVLSAGGRVTRAGDLAVVYMQGCSFATTAADFQQAQQWARSKPGQELVHRDRQAFIARFETIIGRNGSGIATKGGNKVLSRIVKAMEQMGLTVDDWMIPANLDVDEIEVKKKPKPEDEVVAVDAPVEKPD
jgi:hypothetical protein